MDPKASSQLDPKLQEAYDRVMGVATNPPTPTPTPQPTNPTPSPTPPGSTGVQSGPTPNPPITPQAPVVVPAASAPSEEQALPIMPNVTENVKSGTKLHAFVAKSNGNGKKGGMSPVIVALGAVAFLLIYTVAWIKIFNLPVPYINQ